MEYDWFLLNNLQWLKLQVLSALTNKWVVSLMKYDWLLLNVLQW